MLRSHMLVLERRERTRSRGLGRALTVGKKPRVNTLSKLVFPQAPSPMMTSFLGAGHVNGAERSGVSTTGGGASYRDAVDSRGRLVAGELGSLPADDVLGIAIACHGWQMDWGEPVRSRACCRSQSQREK